MSDEISELDRLVRRYKLDDTDQIIVLFYNTVHKVNSKDYTQEQVNAWAPKEVDRKRWENNLTNKITFVAEEGAQILGFAQLEENGHIDCFYCHHNFQQQGVGTLLYEQIESKARWLNLARLFTEASITAKPFFQSKGFKIIHKQAVMRRGVTLVNFQMHKYL